MLFRSGFTGGAMGSVIAFATYFFLTAFRVRKYFMWRVPLGSFLRILIAAVLCGASALACTRLPLGNFLRLVLASVVGASVYAFCLIVSGGGRVELSGLMQKLKRK